MVYKDWYSARYNDSLKRQYWALAERLEEFTSLGDIAPEVFEGQPDPYADEDSSVTLLLPPESMSIK